MWGLDTLVADALKALQPITKKKVKKLENLKQKSDCEIMDYVYSVIKGLPIFEIVQPTDLCFIKCNYMADESRRIGNELFVRHYNFISAVEFYTRAVAHAELGTESLSLAYSNRSHMLLSQRYYKECLQDIDRALSCNPTENLKDKLLKRREKAEELKADQKNIPYHQPVPEIEHKNDFIPVASRSIAVRSKEGKRFHIVATKNIKIGEVLAVETPYASIIKPESKYLHCHECLELCYNLIACENCTEGLYCSEKCREQACKSYHKYECILMKHGFNKSFIFLQMTLKAVTEYDRFMEDLSKDDGIYRSNRYKEIYQKETFKNTKHPKELFLNALEPVVCYHYLTTYTDILEELNIENREQILKELLLRNSFVVQYNKIGIEKIQKNYICTTDFEIVGTGIYSFYSTFPHSCFSNTLPFFFGNKIVIKALDNIKKGAEITTSFGIAFTDMEKSQRQSLLLRDFNYVCQCKPCLNNWPSHIYLKTGAPVPNKFTKKVRNFLSTGPEMDVNQAYKLLSEASTIDEVLRITEVPTENYMLLKCHIFAIFLSFTNKVIDS